MKKVHNLAINYKTAEEFKKFREYGSQELHMLDELEANVIDANIDSPFYGIYQGDELAARMCLYKQTDTTHPIDGTNSEFLIIWKLEVLDRFQGRGLGSALIDYAKSFQLPIKAVSHFKDSRAFFDKHNFKTLEYDIERDLADESLIWYPH
ncbi:GNAT family N-acetyltransferase [Jeotgalicoccus meleagridis]|jgi:GNAT superfamily N-acetyltransferase|uniref:Putative N-acetyltransferase YlbP n=1 Tax=Jeotgalicoccus meleagridis TaxID=2759181 RepID=A0A6V7RM66_9STAP|nr:GNAT family N-acetyltransferase [Jeotgalicoccus meleagridis]CAD2079352.1 putative N-acetyltransferase YlbP [Jeotgalicoccus meleagridis]HIW38310.1 GNAT family N-acetyltransferase [Candidatus Jeotgalicoccus stercoravium]